ncbi:ATP12 family chaperone protein [Croceicoccus naphthovorans]|uniref:Uncharacterized protein n=1 Tax=Croceicoccus naphthovorans TaxID=1348774 RepID=A0A0G3XK95_9SPHN|nr:ATP12 family protein [Croceicoccus naphthovorans]AKM10813.1 hypothetical protein AB433_13900 [Croceicoccus naphthovorans]MBB3989021.1 chaperone required for assembly of F1-ATPase [Croceicoccus naphthovorans]
MKRFWTEVGVAPVDGGGWQVHLDSRPVKTQGFRAQIVPTRALAEALAEEWRAQGEKVDPQLFVLRDMVDFAIDQVAPAPDVLIGSTLPYGDTDTLCYRAPEGDSLRTRQDEAWGPILAPIEAEISAKFALADGVIHAEQPEATRTALRARLEALDPFTLTAVHNMAAIAASLCVALTMLDDGADTDALFGAANLEEDWQAIQWGWDGDALARRDARLAGFTHAARLARLARSED